MSHETARVHLHKVEFLRVVVEDELNGTRANIVDSLCRGDCLCTQVCSQLRR